MKKTKITIEDRNQGTEESFEFDDWVVLGTDNSKENTVVTWRKGSSVYIAQAIMVESLQRLMMEGFMMMDASKILGDEHEEPEEEEPEEEYDISFIFKCRKCGYLMNLKKPKAFDVAALSNDGMPKYCPCCGSRMDPSDIITKYEEEHD